MELDFEKIGQLLSTVESCYANVVNGDICFAEWVATFGWGTDYVGGLEASTDCDSLDGTPLVFLDYRKDGDKYGELEGSWEIALYPEVKVGKPIGCRLPTYKWELSELSCQSEEADAIGNRLWEFVRNRKPVALL